ncbi:MAG: hypothetical protein ACK56I_07885, partial [bacterium]
MSGPHPLASTLCASGAVSGSVCCMAGCGQSRSQCDETEDVCNHRGGGALTTKANCCPSAIRSAGMLCSAARGPPCMLPTPEQAAHAAAGGTAVTAECEGAVNPTGTCTQWCKEHVKEHHCRSCACVPCGFCKESAAEAIAATAATAAAAATAPT